MACGDFARAYFDLERKASRGEMDAFRDAIRDLAREALGENAHWALDRRDTLGAIPAPK